MALTTTVRWPSGVFAETFTRSAQDLAWTGGGGGSGAAGSGVASVAVFLGVESFGTCSGGIGTAGTAGTAGASCLGTLGTTGFEAVLGVGALALIIGTAGRAGTTGTGITGAILCTAAVVAEDGAVDTEVGGFKEPASEGGRVVVGVGTSVTEEGGIVFVVVIDVAGIETSDGRVSTSGLETSTETGAGTGVGTGTGTVDGTGVGTKAGIRTGAEAKAGAAATVTFLLRRRLLAGNGSSGADNHGSLIN